MSSRTFVVFKFYVPDYGLQSRPIPIKASYVNRHGWRHALLKARDTFLTYGLRPLGDIHESHERLWTDGRITYKPRIRQLTPEQVARMKGRARPKTKGARPKGVGWKRRFQRRERR